MSLDYIRDLARKNTDALGFIPLPKLERYERAGQILVGHENEEPCGFLIFGAGRPTLRIYQACIQYDARRREHGLDLVKRLEEAAHERGASGIALWCASDLEANEFWRLAGFEHVATKAGGTRRARSLHGWRKELSMPAQPTLELGL